MRQKLDLEATLSTQFSKAAFSRAQMKVREQGRAGGRNTLVDWLKIRDQMENDRSIIVQELRALQVRISEVRPKAKQDRIDVHQEIVDTSTGSIRFGPLGVEILRELKAIHALLEKKNA